MRIFPAGAPRGLSRLRYRLGAALANTPLLFIGAVLTIAVVFRLGLGVVKPAVAAPEDDLATRPSPHATITPRGAPSSDRPQASATDVAPAAGAATGAPSIAATTTEPDPTAPARPQLLRRKPRTHGKR